MFRGFIKVILFYIAIMVLFFIVLTVSESQPLAVLV
jgi:hypothetical protein